MTDEYKNADRTMSSITNSEYLLLPESGNQHKITNDQYFASYLHITFCTDELNFPLSATEPKVDLCNTVKQSTVRNYYAYQLCSILTQRTKLIMSFSYVHNNNTETDTSFNFFQLLLAFSDFLHAK